MEETGHPWDGLDQLSVFPGPSSRHPCPHSAEEDGGLGGKGLDDGVA